MSPKLLQPSKQQQTPHQVIKSTDRQFKKKFYSEDKFHLAQQFKLYTTLNTPKKIQHLNKLQRSNKFNQLNMVEFIQSQSPSRRRSPVKEGHLPAIASISSNNSVVPSRQRADITRTIEDGKTATELFEASPETPGTKADLSQKLLDSYK